MYRPERISGKASGFLFAAQALCKQYCLIPARQKSFISVQNYPSCRVSCIAESKEEIMSPEIILSLDFSLVTLFAPRCGAHELVPQSETRFFVSRQRK